MVHAHPLSFLPNVTFPETYIHSFNSPQHITSPSRNRVRKHARSHCRDAAHAGQGNGGAAIADSYPSVWGSRGQRAGAMKGTAFPAGIGSTNIVALRLLLKLLPLQLEL